jgi:hypothetical protein
VLTGEQSGPVPLSPGIPTRIMGSPEVAVNLPGIARIRARGPAGSIDELRKNSERAGEKIRKLSEPYGSVPLEELERREEQARALEARLGEHRTRLEARLASLLKEVGDEKPLAEEIARTGLEFEGARAGLQEAEKKLVGYDEDPLRILERLQQRL